MGKLVPILTGATERTKNFEYNFLTICGYLNLVKTSNESFITYSKKEIHRLLQIKMLDRLLCMKLGPFVSIKGNNSYKIM